MNMILIVLILLVAVLAFYFIFVKGDPITEEVDDSVVNKYSISILAESLVSQFDEIMQTDYALLNLNKYETLKYERNRDELSKALRTCAQGDLGSKMYVKDYTRDILQRKLGINQTTINQAIPFNNKRLLTVQDKFEILLFLFRDDFGDKALQNMIEYFHWTALKECSNGDTLYEVTEKDVHEAFDKLSEQVDSLDFYDQLNILSQRVYQLTFGLGVVDEIRDQDIDGFRCGTSGIPEMFFTGSDAELVNDEQLEYSNRDFNAIWVTYHGIPIHFSCIGFGSLKEFERVAKLIYRYNNPGSLDAEKGYIVNFSKDGCRVCVARPRFSESWMFFIRKHSTSVSRNIADLYPFPGVEKLIMVIKYIVAGRCNIAITGPQGTGKTTLLASIIKFVPASLSIRVQEMAYELYLRAIYTNRDIATFCETDSIPAQQGIDFMKKTDGKIGVFSEIAQAVVAALAIQMGQVGVEQLFCTHHAKTAKDLIQAIRDNVIEYSGFSDETIVERTVARVMNFDVHLEMREDGTRYVERVTMIVPLSEKDYPTELEDAQREYYYRQTDRPIFKDFDIVRFENGQYIFVNDFTDDFTNQISKKLSESEVQQFYQLKQQIQSEIAR